MKNNLSKVENCLRSIARRNKCIKYSLGLAILFLMMGISAFSEEVVTQQEVMTTDDGTRRSSSKITMVIMAIWSKLYVQ